MACIHPIPRFRFWRDDMLATQALSAGAARTRPLRPFRDPRSGPVPGRRAKTALRPIAWQGHCPHLTPPPSGGSLFLSETPCPRMVVALWSSSITRETTPAVAMGHNPYTGTGLTSECPSSTSSSLLERARAKDPQAWERLCRVYGPVVYHWARNAGLQDQDAADIGQKVCRTVPVRRSEPEASGGKNARPSQPNLPDGQHR